MEINMTIEDIIEEKKKEHLRKVEALREIKEMLKNKKKIHYIKEDEYIPCKHNECPDCVGTGVKLDGTPCIHHISCPCPKCTPTY